MALAALPTGMHPFFAKICEDHNSERDHFVNESSTVGPEHVYSGEHALENEQSRKEPRKRRKLASSMFEENSSGCMVGNQLSLEQLIYPLQTHKIDKSKIDGDIHIQQKHSKQNREEVREVVSLKSSTDLTESVPSQSPQASESQQQRAAMVQFSAVSQYNTLQIPSLFEQEKGVERAPESGKEAAVQVVPSTTTNAYELDTMAVPSPNIQESKHMPLTRQIKVTSNGKLLSSPVVSVTKSTKFLKKKRGRKPTKPSHHRAVLVIKYGTDSASRLAFGQKIQKIINGERLVAIVKSQRQEGPNKAESAKATHPFFTGKPTQRKDLSTDELVPRAIHTLTPRKSSVTPGKLRSETRRDRSSGLASTFGLLPNSVRTTKQCSLNEAPWPSQGAVHIRNLENSDDMMYSVDQESMIIRGKYRKLKNNVISLSCTEDIVSRLARDLGQRDMVNHILGHSESTKDVRLPRRLLITGVEIRQRILDQLKPYRSQRKEQSAIQESMHLAITMILDDILHILTPFDEGKCENQEWTRKYAPQRASHVLQAGPEATVLKSWLQYLTIATVDNGLKMSQNTGVKDPPRKKRKKAVDTFIVSDEEQEDEDMVRLAVTESACGYQPNSLCQPRWTRHHNVVVLSGPHGCGKSATVYAVAKELGFEVFEINSGVRRSGKDIYDKVGDMTANHLVNHKRNTSATKKEDPTAFNDASIERVGNALRKDLNSGRQDKMASFFKDPDGISSRKVKKSTKGSPKTSNSGAETMLNVVEATRKSQKQSLILFEEADILFEEDQQFWTQVIKLASQSKRPIVITCNDENQIPIQALPLAAILRLHTPPVNLAVDYLLALAGKEGHILDREAIEGLYKSKKEDLRASIAELNFWCQMSVGDRKGGLEWIYQRWPPGKDVNESGHLLRVASEGTYQCGMGWVSHNTFEARENAAFDKEEELFKQTWTNCNFDSTPWEELIAECMQPFVAGEATVENLKTLKRLDVYSETWSAADIFCSVDLPSYHQIYREPTDPTQPPLTEKARLNYTLDASVLQIDHQSDFSRLDCSISIQTDLLTRRAFPEFCQACSNRGPSKKTSSEKIYAKAILAHQDRQKENLALERASFAAAFDMLATPPDCTNVEKTSYNLTLSSFDRTLRIIALDLAPYIRSIVAHEQVLEAQRIHLSSLLSVGGPGKRSRTTRASRTALEGGQRRTKRKDRWFDKDLSFDLVMQTAGRLWAGLGWNDRGSDGTTSLTNTQESFEHSFLSEMQE